MLVAVRLRLLRSGLLAIALLVCLAPFPPPGARGATPRVVVVVGPVGGLTDDYRADGRAAAAEARRYTDDVVTIYSPNATWPAVRRALQGASLVVYLGHGNGWPSRYGTTLNPRTQDGLGLNPVAGVDDVAHQYFGEWHLANRVRLAPGALVVLSHLCYASGNSEPGLPEGSLDVAKQRVDNFAAGWLAAGAGAVLVDAYLPPAHYVRAALEGTRRSERIWRTAPSFHGHELSFPSERTPGAVAHMDPERRTGGYTRSLVVAAGAGGPVPGGRGADRQVPARMNPQVAAGPYELVLPAGPAPPPDAFALGALPGVPALVGSALAGAAVELALPVEVPTGVTLGPGYRLGMRWIPLDVPGAPAEAAPGAPAEADPGTPSTLVAPESAAALVEVVPADVREGAVAAPARLPTTPGRYRLEVTIHDGDAVALPYAVQASIPPVIVHVGGPGVAWLDAPASLTVAAGTRASVQVLVVNGEADPWGPCAASPEQMGPDVADDCPTVHLVARWLPIDAGTAPGRAEPMSAVLAVPAATAVPAWLGGPVPSIPGMYLLVVSVERSADGSPLEVLGQPTTVAVEVVGAPLLPPPGG
jgi:hypothetical protein